MSNLKQRINEYLRENSRVGVDDTLEADYREYMRQRDEIERRGVQESLDRLKQDLSEERCDGSLGVTRYSN
jgi:hypothetical protein